MDFDFGNDEMAVNWIFDPKRKAFFDLATDEKLPFAFNPDTGVFCTSKGVSLTVNPVNKFILAEYMNTFRENEPMPPEIKVQISDKEWTTERNTNDTYWKMAYNHYWEKANLEVFKFMVSMSIEATIPPDVDKRILRMASRLKLNPDNGTWEDDRLYYFVQDSIGGDSRELSAFMEILKGRNLITQEALKRSEARFQDTSSGDESANIQTTIEG